MLIEELLSLSTEEYIRIVEKQVIKNNKTIISKFMKTEKKVTPELSFKKAVQSRRIKSNKGGVSLPRLGNYIKR